MDPNYIFLQFENAPFMGDFKSIKTIKLYYNRFQPA